VASIISQPVVRITSGTAAEVHIDGEVEHVLAADSLALRDRVVESLRLLAASSGDAVTATLVDGSAQWQLVVSPDGAFTEQALPAQTAATPAPAIPPQPAAPPAPAVSDASAAETPAPVSARTRPQPEPIAAAPAPAPVATPSDVPAPPAPLAATATVEPVRQKPTVDDLLSTRQQLRRDRATTGWRGFVRRSTGGVISPRPNKAERSRLERQRTVQRRFDGSRTIVILNPKGGAHKTTSTLLLAATFGTLRGGSTLAWDNNETRGTLGWRAQNTPHHLTAVDLLEDIDRFASGSDASLAQLDDYVRTQVDARFDVLASDEDAAASSTIDADAFRELHRMLSRYYRLIIIDTGNNMRASNWEAAVDAADQLVIVSTVREDTGASAAWLLDGLRERGFGQKIDEAVTVLASASERPDKRLTARLDDHFEQVTGTVVHVPFDPSLVDGGPIDFDALAPRTRDAWLTVGATVAERL
jgi:MinD-like ATPase involved in chromosome partitioning or flagellar assembly